MYGLEMINWMNEGDNYKKVLSRRQLNYYPGKPASTNGHNTAIKALLEAGNHPLLTIREVLETLLSGRDSIPLAVRQSLEAARDLAWSTFMAEKKRTSKPVSNFP